MPLTLNLEAEALQRQMESTLERAKRLPIWLTRSSSLAASNSENSNNERPENGAPAIKEPD